MYVYTECWFNKCYTYGHTGKKEKNGGKETKTARKSEESRGSPKGEYCHFMDPPPLPDQEGKKGEGVKQRAERSSLVPNVAFRKFRLIPAFQFFCM